MNFHSLKVLAKNLKQHTLTVYFVARDANTPILVKLLALCVAAYALSPIDLIPDFIPVIGYLDDLILIPLGLALVFRLTPPQVIIQAQLSAHRVVDKPVSYAAAAIIAAVWILTFYLVFIQFMTS